MQHQHELVRLAKGLIDAGDLNPGGAMRPEAAERLISMVFSYGTLRNFTTRRMRRMTADIAVMSLSSRSLVRVAEGSDPSDGQRLGASQYGCTLTALPVQLFPQITLSWIRDNADNPNLVTEVETQFATLIEAELEDLAFNGTDDDYSGSAWLELNEGWIQIATDDGNCPKVNIAPGTSVAATLATGVVANNNALTWTARQAGSSGNNIAVTLKDPAGNNQSLSVTVYQSNVGAHILVSLATGVAGAITSTGATVKAAIEASADADSLVSVAHTGASTGAAAVVAVGKSYLSGCESIGWRDSLAAAVAGLPAAYRPQTAIIMNIGDADDYWLEVAQHVTGQPLATEAPLRRFSGYPIITSPYMPAGKVLVTPPQNLVVGMTTDIWMKKRWDDDARALRYVYDTACDFQIAVKQACVLAS